MSEVGILDASAVLAYLQGENGQERVEAALDAGPCRLSAVNLCEVLGKLCDKGMPPEEAQAAVLDLGLAIVDFDEELAARAAFLRARTRPIGAALGDRACLALAEHIADAAREAQTAPAAGSARPANGSHAAEAGLSPVVLTAERAWAKLKWPFKVVVIR